MARAGINQATEVKQQGKAVLNEQKIAVQSSVEGLKEGVRTFVEAESGPDTEIQVAPPNSLSNNPETPGNELLDTLTDL